MAKGIVSNAELDKCIAYWDSKLFHDKYLMNSTTQYLVENTSKLLKELKEVRHVGGGETGSSYPS